MRLMVFLTTLWIINGIILVPSLAQSSPALTTTSGTGSAVEGDLLTVNGTMVRLWGIDAPDKGQKCFNRSGSSYDCFESAKSKLQGLIGQNQITCYVRGQDIHGQKLATCAVNGLDLAALLVRSGWAFAYPALTPHYIPHEGYAQAQKRGLFAGRALAPWLWRAEEQQKKFLQSQK